jgi:hypothetical protein
MLVYPRLHGVTSHMKAIFIRCQVDTPVSCSDLLNVSVRSERPYTVFARVRQAGHSNKRIHVVSVMEHSWSW